MGDETKYQKLKDIIKIYLPEDVSVDAIIPESKFLEELGFRDSWYAS